jgi:hypothetical protein
MTSATPKPVMLRNNQYLKNYIALSDSRLAERKGSDVSFDINGPHAIAHIGIKAESKRLHEDALSKRYVIKINRLRVVDNQRCFRIWETLRDFVEDDT